MRVVFMGTPDFAVPSLRALAAAHDVLAAYTAPDKPAGRGLHLQPSAVKVAADALGLDVVQPVSFKDAATVESLAALRPDAVCVAAYGLILPRAVLNVPRLGSLNVHASLLPRWRGAAPIERAILAGDRVTGVSIMLMQEGLDTGPFALQVAVQADEAPAAELRSALAQAGARALLAVLDEVTTGVVSWTEQDESRATYAAKITAADVALSPDVPVADALRRVRASGPTAPSRAALGGRLVVVERLAPHAGAIGVGLVAADVRGTILGFADGAAVIERLRPAGKGSMDGASYARGARFGPESRWEAAS